MSHAKKIVREHFRESVFRRDHYRCRACGVTGVLLDAHHITDRGEMPGGGYVTSNGIALCPSCHERAEARSTGFDPSALYALIGSTRERALVDAHGRT